jgi:hypothetical protein
MMPPTYLQNFKNIASFKTWIYPPPPGSFSVFLSETEIGMKAPIPQYHGNFYWIRLPHPPFPVGYIAHPD